MEALIKSLCQQITALCGAHNHDYHIDISRLWRNMRLLATPEDG